MMKRDVQRTRCPAGLSGVGRTFLFLVDCFLCLLNFSSHPARTTLIETLEILKTLSSFRKLNFSVYAPPNKSKPEPVWGDYLERTISKRYWFINNVDSIYRYKLVAALSPHLGVLFGVPVRDQAGSIALRMPKPKKSTS